MRILLGYHFLVSECFGRVFLVSGKDGIARKNCGATCLSYLPWYRVVTRNVLLKIVTLGKRK